MERNKKQSTRKRTLNQWNFAFGCDKNGRTLKFLTKQKKVEISKVAETKIKTEPETETNAETGTGTETNNDTDDDTDTAELEIENLNIQQATELIKQCVSENTLTKLLEKDKRAGIKDAINAQLKKLKEVENV